MARGWESKEVESQIEAARERPSGNVQPRRSPQQLARERERDGLQLSRTRVLSDMANAANPRYREQLQRSLDFLDAKLASLDAESAG